MSFFSQQFDFKTRAMELAKALEGCVDCVPNHAGHRADAEKIEKALREAVADALEFESKIGNGAASKEVLMEWMWKNAREIRSGE